MNWSCCFEFTDIYFQSLDLLLQNTGEQYNEQSSLKILRIELSETLELVEKMKHQLRDAKESEAQAFEVMSEAQMQLEAAKATAKVILSDSLKSKKDYCSLASELEQSKAQVNTLEKLVSQLHGDLDSSNAKKKAKEAIEELKSDLASKQNIVQKISHENEELKNNHTTEMESELRVELKKVEEDLTEMKSALLDKETQFQTLAEENEILRTEIANASAEPAKEGEKEVIVKLGSLAEEANERSQRSTKFAELLDTTQMEKAELEAELKRLKVQADQWRKAAEAAAAILSPGCDAKVAEGTVSVDTIGMKMDSPFSDSMDDDSPKKKNANMLKKIGGLWKKGQK